MYFKSMSDTMYILSMLRASFLVGVFMYLPWMLHSKVEDEYLALQDSVSERVFLHSCLLSVAVTIPLVLDALLDRGLPIHVSAPRIQLLISQIVPNLLIYISGNMEYSQRVTVFSASYHARELLLFSSLFSYYMGDTQNPYYFMVVICTWVLTIVGAVFHTFYIFPSLSFAGMREVGIIVSALGFGGLMLLCITRMFYFYRNMHKQRAKYGVIYVACLILSNLAKWIVFAAYSVDKVWTDRGGGYFALLTLVDVAVAVIASTLPGRIARYDASLAKMMLDTKRNFVRYISHEIRTPLNTVYMGIQLAVQEIAATPAASHLVDVMRDIQSSCNVSIEILNDLLTYDKLEDGTLTLQPKLTNLRDLLLSILKPFLVQARQCEVEFNFMGEEYFSPDLDDAVVEVDVNKISQVIRNLVSNALKFTPRGGQVSVVTSIVSKSTPREEGDTSELRMTDIPRNYVKISVLDTGPGISEENQKRLFKEIVQFNAADLQNGKGSGLGLWISKGIMDLHGGHIGMKSDCIPGAGCTFFIELPVQCLRQPGTEPSDLGSMALCRTSRENSMTEYEIEFEQPITERLPRCLIVDDSGFNRKMMCKALSKVFVDIAEACDGIDAVQQVEIAKECGREFNVIFMDSIMPRMGGIEATRIIRTKLHHKGVMLGATGNILPEDIAEFTAAGVDRVLAKPLQLREVHAALTEFHSRL